MGGNESDPTAAGTEDTALVQFPHRYEIINASISFHCALAGLKINVCYLETFQC
jgi:hypothetical protein